MSEAALAVREGRVSPLELVDGCLERIDRYEDRLKAWVRVDREGARELARVRGEEARQGQFRGPLHGVPIGIKDIIDVVGWPTKAGSLLREGHLAPTDAPVVAGLREAGAIILGKTVTVEFACFDPSPSRNPWSPTLSHTPGGSSSGSAVAVAMGMCLGALGTQTGGSLVRPSTYCGVATCKATFGRVSRDGVVPVSYHFDHVGPIARRVADLALMLRALPTGSDFCPPGRAPEPAAGNGQPARPPRLRLLGGYFHDTADAAIRELTAGAVDRLRQAGAQVEEVPKPMDFSTVRKPMHWTIMAVEAAAVHRAAFAEHRDAFGPMLREFLDEGLSYSAVTYAELLARLRAYRRRVVRLLDGADALLVPSTHTTAPPTLTTTGTSEFQAPWSAAGLPVVSIPCGVASDGMPGAVQLVGRYHGESDLLAAAGWCEQAIGFDRLAPLWTEQAEKIPAMDGLAGPKSQRRPKISSPATNRLG